MSAIFLWVALAGAHALAPAGLDLTIVEGRDTEVIWRTSAVAPTGVRLAPEWPVGCSLSAEAAQEDDEGALVQHGVLACQTPLVGRVVKVVGLAGADVDVVITVRDGAGGVRRTLLHDPVVSWTVGMPGTVAPPARAPWRWFGALRALLWAALCVEWIARGRRWPWLAYLLGTAGLVLAWVTA